MRTAAASSACTSASSSARPSSPAMTSCGRGLVDDIDVLAAAEHLKGLEAQPPVRRALAGLEVVLVAVPRADEVHLVGREPVPVPGAVGRQHVLDLVHDDALAGRPALMNAQVLVGVEPPLPVEHADLDAVM